MPTASGSTTPCRRLHAGAGQRQAEADRVEERLEHLRERQPRRRCRCTDATTPTMSASPSTIVSTCRRIAPTRAQHGELAHALGDRDREGVEDDEGAHEHRRARRRPAARGVRKALIELRDLGPSAAWPPAAGLHLDEVRQRPRAMRVRSCGRRHAGSPSTEIVDVWPTRSYQCWASGERGRDDGRAADRRHVAELEDADDRHRLRADQRRQPDALADVQVLVGRGLLDQRHLAVRVGVVAGDERVLVERLGQRREDQVRGAALGGQVLAVDRRASRPPGSGPRPWRRRHLAHLRDQRCRQRADLVLAGAAAERGPAAEVHVDARVCSCRRSPRRRCRIWSVMTNVPAIIAMPSTIAIMVRTVRSLWLSRLRSA